MGGNPAYHRTIPRTPLRRGDMVIVTPDTAVLTSSIAALSAQIPCLTGEEIEVIPGAAITDDQYHNRPLIVIGHLTNNLVMRRLYTARYSFIDAWYPGGDGFFVKSVIDPFGTGRNVILYTWIVPHLTAHYLLARDDERYFRDGHIRTLADLALMTIDNRGDECTYGDTGGYVRGTGGSLWALAAASWYYEDPRYIQAYRRLSGNRTINTNDLLEGTYLTPALVVPQQPSIEPIENRLHSSPEPRTPNPESLISPLFLARSPPSTPVAPDTSMCLLESV